jgi:peptidoglycan/xylan/chitin deacetylase (PgdA/CDA1 family)
VNWFTRNFAAVVAPGGQRARLSVLIYHRVLPTVDPLFPAEVDAAAFDGQMKCLTECFNVLPLNEAVERLQRGDLPSRAVCVTFDDGYADNAEVALPILQRYGIRATFFIASGFLDGGWMFNDRVIESVRSARGDQLDLTQVGVGEFDISTNAARRQTIDALLTKLKYLPPMERDSEIDRITELVHTNLPPSLMMRTEQVRTLHAAGMEIGGHTAHHPILARLDPAAARAEIAAGKEQLEAIIGAPLRLFAYPNGKPVTDYTREHVEMVKSLGFKAAMSTAWGVATRAADHFQLPRFTPWENTPGKFGLRLVQNMLRTQPTVV